MFNRTVPIIVALMIPLAAAQQAHAQTPYAAIGTTNAVLRAAHLKYHLAMLDLLTQSQVQRYSELRGYAGATAPHAPGSHERRHGRYPADRLGSAPLNRVAHRLRGLTCSFVPLVQVGTAPCRRNKIHNNRLAEA